MRIFVFLPPVRAASGGVAVLRSVAKALARDGREAYLVPREQGRAELGDADAPVVPWESLRLGPGDVWLVPEGWPNALLPGLSAGARCVVYVQNWAYLFSGLPEGAHWQGLPVSFLAVSDPVRSYLRETLGVNAPVLRPGIDPAFFAAVGEKTSGRPVVAYMPRKNKAVCEQVREGLAARLRTRGLASPLWRPIERMTPAQVASALAQSHVFFAAGFPEGLGLPPLEAMAAGCLCAGFGGYGGFDYMRQAGDFAGAYHPWYPLREVAWGGNGLWCADADAPAAINALEQALAWIEGGDERLGATIEAGRLTAKAYSREAHEAAVLDVFGALSR